MYISKLKIKGYKNTYEESVVEFNKGLNILIGENGCGKTAVINSLRMLLRETDSLYSISTDDFYCSLDRKVSSSEITIDADFSDLSDNEKLIFLSCCDAEFNAHLHLQMAENLSKPGLIKRRYWGGYSTAGIFEDDVFDKIECIYLPPLRDAESKLSAGRKSRLIALLKKVYGDDTKKLVNSVTDFNAGIMENRGGQYSEIASIKNIINGKILETLGKQLGQSINLQFSETTFNRIIENIRMVFYPRYGENDINLFRDISTNSLGYNNLLYIATVFSELELIKESDVFTILLIEEPEAHLHPQLQIKFIKYLERLSATLKNAQIIVSTHSPVLSSSVSIDKLIHLSGSDKRIQATTLSQKDFNDPLAKNYINRWMDATKSTMLFSRGILMVEGISETLLLPKLAEIVIRKYCENHPEDVGIGATLDEMGISIVNLNGINFKYFMKLFGNFRGSTDEKCVASAGPNIPIFCAGITDRDPSDEKPQKGDTPVSNNPISLIENEINQNDYTRIYISPLKTFEYDLAICNPICLAKTLTKIWPTQNGSVCEKLSLIIGKDYSQLDSSILSEDAAFIYEHISRNDVGKGLFAHTLIDEIPDDFDVPRYIEDAILWACGGRLA